jgi:ketosteroid isomerase-like protein
MNQQALGALFAAIDAKDADRFASFLTEDGRFVYGSNPAVEGRAAVREFVAGFFGQLKALHHSVEKVWEHPGELLLRGRASYTLPDDRVVTVPFVNVFTLAGEKIRAYEVFVDPTPLAG